MASRLFEFIDCLTVKKKPINFNDPEIEREYSQYAIDNALSMCNMIIPIVAEASIRNLSKRDHAAFYLATLPQRKLFFDWTKKKKNISSSDREYIADYYNCSLKTADEYLLILTEEQVKTITKMF